jgi:rhodanese-related sulfurtransferase
MSLTVKDMMATANAAVEMIDTEEARGLINKGALLLDVRDAPEVEKSGLAEGAHHVSRGMLEFRADPETPFHDTAFAKDRPIVLYCASGGRAALAGKLLIDMGYNKVYNLGGFKNWVEADGAVQHVVDPGMG